MKIKLFTVPNILTLANLFCGCVAAIYILMFRDLTSAFWLVVAAAVFDFLDGFSARLTRQYSEIGKQLDSLADMVSFGFVPSAVLYVSYIMTSGVAWFYFGLYATLLVVLFSALRLAKFNIDDTQVDGFCGLPTPACALFVVSCGWLYATGDLAVSPLTIIISSVLLSFLLVSNIRMFALKFKSFAFKGNEVRYLFMAASALALILFRIWAIPFIIGGYVLISILLNIFCKKHLKKV